jgi:methyltransferase (TIGR00027 family)
MKENQASFTAMMQAYMHAYHAIHSTEKIFDDFLAYDLIPKEKQALIEQYLIEHYLTCDKGLDDPDHTKLPFDQAITSTFLMQIINGIISRARYAEDTLKKTVKLGVNQYIILGAGMDTFAFRRPDLMEKLEAFEVDHPATQEFKLCRLAELKWKHPAKLHFIPIDFTKESLLKALMSSSFYDPKAKSFFSWLGVTSYLTKEDIFATLSSIAEVAPAGSILVFNYADTTVFIPEKLSPQMQEFLKLLRAIGEPMKMGGSDSSMLAEDLESLGFQLHENVSPTDIKRCYLKGRKNGCSEYGYFACAVFE